MCNTEHNIKRETKGKKEKDMLRQRIKEENQFCQFVLHNRKREREREKDILRQRIKEENQFSQYHRAPNRKRETKRNKQRKIYFEREN